MRGFVDVQMEVEESLASVASLMSGKGIQQHVGKRLDMSATIPAMPAASQADPDFLDR